MLTESQIRSWIDLYGEIKSDFVEEAEEDKEDGSSAGTGAYLVSVKLLARIPNMIPMFGQKITISHEGIAVICKKCYYYHKKGVECSKRGWQDYVSEFKADHPRIMEMMFEVGDVIFGKQEEGTEKENYEPNFKDEETDETNEHEIVNASEEQSESEDNPEDESSESSEESEQESQTDIVLSQVEKIEFDELCSSGTCTEKEILKILKMRRRK